MTTHDRAAHALGHLTLALAGACLTVAELAYLPELPLLLAFYLAAVALSWWSAGRWAVSNAVANGLGLLIAGAAAGWVVLRLRAPFEGLQWFDDVALHALLVPFLGPVVMALLAVRLFQPRAPGDFWVFQGLGLLQVALGCVLADDTLFAPLLLAYLATGLCALAARERQAQAWRSAAVAVAAASPRRGWVLFGLLWGAAAAVLAVPLFLVTPRHDGPEWRPFERFSARPQREEKARTGFSDEIDLSRVGTLEVDDSPAFTVQVTDAAGHPVAGLPPDQRWRGVVLDNYEEGTWRSDLTWPGNGAMARTATAPPLGPGAREITFKVSGRVGGLFLADPVWLGPLPGQVPVRSLMATRGPLFFESGATAVPAAYLAHGEYRYVQSLAAGARRDRAPALRLRNGYVFKLLHFRIPGLADRASQLLRALAVRHGERGLLEELDRPRLDWEALPPRYWEVVGRLFRDHLAASGEYTYSLTRERVRPELDPVQDFLTHSKRGPCERFASALALLLRSQGVPARVIKGYRGAEAQGEGHYLVRQSHAHAWVEAAVPAQGEGELTYEWLTLDPTPDNDGGESERSALARWWQQQQRSGRELWEELIVGYNSSQQASLREELASGRLALAALPWVGLGVGALAVVALARHVRRRWRPRAPGARSLYRRLCELLAAAGLTAEPGETPAELARRAGERLAGREAAGVPARVVEMYYRARYGGQPAGAAELAEAADGLARLRRALRSREGGAAAGAVTDTGSCREARGMRHLRSRQP